MENQALDTRKEETSCAPPTDEPRKELTDREEPFLQNEHNVSFFSSFIIELIIGTKAFLNNLRHLAQVSKSKFADKETETIFHQIVTEIDNMDVVVNGLANFIRLNAPIKRNNTVHAIIEEVLKKNQLTIDHKGILLFKKFEEDLPESIVADEQLKYILNSTFQYALALMPQNGGLGIFTKCFHSDRDKGDDQAFSKHERGYVEILTVFTGNRKQNDQHVTEVTSSSHSKKEALELVLRLIKESVQRNHGVMKIDVEEKKIKTFISLRFPVERRQKVYYHQENE